MLLSDRTKVVRAVLGFLAFCALIGFVMGLRSALPRGGEDTEPQGPPAEATSNVVVEATPAQETAAPAANEPAANEEAAATTADAKQAEEEKAATKAEQTKPVQPTPAAAPPEEAPSNDAVGQILDQQQEQNAPTPPSLY